MKQLRATLTFAGRTLIVILLVLALHLLVGCAAPKRFSRPTYSAPSSQKVQSGIATAQTSIAKAVAVHAKKATDSLIQLETRTVATPELHELATAARGEVDAFTHELTIAQNALAAAEVARAELQVRVETQTAQLNDCELEKNEALRLEDLAKKNADRCRKQRNQLGLLTLALLFWIFRQPLLKLGGVLFKAARLACGIPV